MNLIRIFLLFGFFLKEVVVANLQIARLVLWRASALRPAIVKIPLDIKTDRGIFLLSSMITLTPGTLSLEVSGCRQYLYVHITHAENPEEVVESIKRGFERRLMEVGC